MTDRAFLFDVPAEASGEQRAIAELAEVGGQRRS